MPLIKQVLFDVFPGGININDSIDDFLRGPGVCPPAPLVLPAAPSPKGSLMMSSGYNSIVSDRSSAISHFSAF